MMNTVSENEIYEQAKKRVEQKKGFYIHLIVYCLVNILLYVIWNITGAAFPWFAFPLGGWGIGLLFHFLGVFLFSKQTRWERNQINKELERYRDAKGN
jgi:hypothetical protein